VLEIVGLGAACEIAAANLGSNANHMRQMRDAFEHGIRARVGEVRVNGSLNHRLPNTSSLSFRGLTADELMREIEERVALSAGAACHSGQVRVSAVIQAIRVPEEWAKGTIRISTGRMTNVEEIELAIEVVSAAVTRIRRAQELP
jgi:cysteine desulfurase